MKLSTRDANAYFARPDPTKTGLLIYGGDAMRVALKRQEFLKALLGKDAEEEMRLTRIQAAELRREPALLRDIKTPMRLRSMTTHPTGPRLSGCWLMRSCSQSPMPWPPSVI